MIAVAVLGEEMHSYHFIGGGVILLGIFLVQKLRAPLNFRRQSVTKKQIVSRRCESMSARL